MLCSITITECPLEIKAQAQCSHSATPPTRSVNYNHTHPLPHRSLVHQGDIRTNCCHEPLSPFRVRAAPRATRSAIPKVKFASAHTVGPTVNLRHVHVSQAHRRAGAPPGLHGRDAAPLPHEWCGADPPAWHRLRDDRVRPRRAHVGRGVQGAALGHHPRLDSDHRHAGRRALRQRNHAHRGGGRCVRGLRRQRRGGGGEQSK